jgi:hypothetical protein
VIGLRRQRSKLSAFVMKNSGRFGQRKLRSELVSCN